MAEIFLSYRRADDPGYVGRLADSLNELFGKDSVYRDVDSVRAGENWKRGLARALSSAQVVLAVIGPRWQNLLADYENAEQDWIRFELNQARSLDVPVIPILLGRTSFDDAADLGDLAWISDLQFFELADGQGRWSADINRLAKEIEQATSLRARHDEGPRVSSLSQTSHGHQSPNVDSGGGDVNITFGTHLAD